MIDSVGINVLSKTEDIANARIQFENGCVANLSASRMSLKKAREIRIFQDNAYLSLDFMNQSGHLVRRSDIIAYGLKMKIGLVKTGETPLVTAGGTAKHKASNMLTFHLLEKSLKFSCAARTAISTHCNWIMVRALWRICISIAAASPARFSASH